MVQIARPDSDISTGGWEPQGSTAETTLWESLDEVTANDGTDYIEALDGENITCEVGLDNSIVDPGGNTGYFLRIRIQGTGSGGPERVNIALFEGASQRAISGNFNNRGSWADFSYELTTAQADAITAFTDLRIKITSSSLAATEDMWVTQAFFEVPDPAASGSGVQTFGGLTQAGVGVMQPSGAGAQALSALLQSGVAAEIFAATGVQSLASLTQAGVGLLHPSGAGAQTFVGLTQAGVAVEIFVGTGAQVLAALTQAGVGETGEDPSGSGVQTLAALLQNGAGAQKFSGSGAQIFAALSQSGVGATRIVRIWTLKWDAASGATTGTGVQTFASLTQAGSGVEIVTATGAQALPTLIQAGVGA